MYRINVNGDDADRMVLANNDIFSNADESMFIAPSVSGIFGIGILDVNSNDSEIEFTIELVTVPAKAPGGFLLVVHVC